MNFLLAVCRRAANVGVILRQLKAVVFCFFFCADPQPTTTANRVGYISFLFKFDLLFTFHSFYSFSDFKFPFSFQFFLVFHFRYANRIIYPCIELLVCGLSSGGQKNR